MDHDPHAAEVAREKLGEVGYRRREGHTHTQFDRQIGDSVSSTPAASGCRTPTSPAPTGCSSRTASREHRRTEYDLEAAAERIRPTGWPIAERWVNENLLTVPTARDAAEFFEQQRAKR